MEENGNQANLEWREFVVCYQGNENTRAEQVFDPESVQCLEKEPQHRVRTTSIDTVTASETHRIPRRLVLEPHQVNDIGRRGNEKDLHSGVVDRNERGEEIKISRAEDGEV